MRDILITLFKYRKSTQGEALLEFLFSLAIDKLILVREDLNLILFELETEEDEIINFYYRQIIKNLVE